MTDPAPPSVAVCGSGLLVNTSAHKCLELAGHEGPHSNQWITWTTYADKQWKRDVS